MNSELPESPETSVLELLRKTAPFVGPQRTRFAGVVLLALCVAAMGACEPLVMKVAFDEIGGSKRARVLLLAVAGLFGAMIVREALTAFLDMAIWRVRIGVHFAITRRTVERLHALPLSYHQKQSVGAIMTKMDRGINGAVAAFSDVAFSVIPSLLYLVVSVIAMAHLDLRLTAMVLVFTPFPPLVGAWAAREQSRRERDLMRRWTRIFARFNEVLGGILIVKSFAMEEVEKRRFLHGVEEANGLVLKGVRRDAAVNAAKNAAAAIARIAAIGAGAWLAVREGLGVGTLVAFVAYTTGLFGPVQGITGVYQTLRKGMVALETVFSILDAGDALGDAPDAIRAHRLRGEVEFRDVSFAYRPGTQVLEHVSLHVGSGEKIALVGASGTGKTTMMALLQRLYDPTSGAIFLDGQELRRYQQKSIREQIGVVLQDNVLFSDSIADNIAFGCPGATREQIERAARDANAHDFIMALPDRYDALAGERGCVLSAGQRQRIAIARALLRDPSILVLDEATSAQDAESEAAIQDALVRLCDGRTTFIIAHRLSTVVSADRIIVVRGGRIVETGRHAELLAAGGYYAGLVRKQAGGLLAA